MTSLTDRCRRLCRSVFLSENANDRTPVTSKRDLDDFRLGVGVDGSRVEDCGLYGEEVTVAVRHVAQSGHVLDLERDRGTVRQSCKRADVRAEIVLDVRNLAAYTNNTFLKLLIINFSVIRL